MGVLNRGELRGHLVGLAVGAYFFVRLECEGFETMWWYGGVKEGDFVICNGSVLTAIEVIEATAKVSEGRQYILPGCFL